MSNVSCADRTHCQITVNFELLLCVDIDRIIFPFVVNVAKLDECDVQTVLN